MVMLAQTSRKFNIENILINENVLKGDKSMAKYKQSQWNIIIKREIESGFSRGETSVVIRCKEILLRHQPEVYPGGSHQAPMVSKAIWNNMRPSDRVINRPASGFGPSLTVSFRDSSWFKERSCLGR